MSKITIELTKDQAVDLVGLLAHDNERIERETGLNFSQKKSHKAFNTRIKTILIAELVKL